MCNFKICPNCKIKEEITQTCPRKYKFRIKTERLKEKILQDTT